MVHLTKVQQHVTARTYTRALMLALLLYALPTSTRNTQHAHTYIQLPCTHLAASVCHRLRHGAKCVRRLLAHGAPGMQAGSRVGCGCAGAAAALLHAGACIHTGDGYGVLLLLLAAVISCKTLRLLEQLQHKALRVTQPLPALVQLRGNTCRGSSRSDRVVGCVCGKGWQSTRELGEQAQGGKQAELARHALLHPCADRRPHSALLWECTFAVHTHTALQHT